LQVYDLNPPTINFRNYFLVKKLENFGSKSPRSLDLDEYSTKVSNCLKFQISRKQLISFNAFIQLETLPNTCTSTYFLATIFSKSTSRPTSEILEVNQFVIVTHALIADICSKLPSSSLYICYLGPPS